MTIMVEAATKAAQFSKDMDLSCVDCRNEAQACARRKEKLRCGMTARGAAPEQAFPWGWPSSFFNHDWEKYAPFGRRLAAAGSRSSCARSSRCQRQPLSRGPPPPKK